MSISRRRQPAVWLIVPPERLTVPDAPMPLPTAKMCSRAVEHNRSAGLCECSHHGAGTGGAAKADVQVAAER